MKTYQDLIEVGESEKDRMAFILSVINDHKLSDKYRIAKDAEEYAQRRNVTIAEYQKLLYTITGEAVPDNYSASYKMPSSFFHRFITQENQHLLGNGVSFEKDETKKKLGGVDFDTRLQQAGKYALIEGVSFGFWNLDHLEVFKLSEFAPLYDEENSALKAGVRFWQIAPDKPLRATLYELDGYTEYIWRESEGEILKEKRSYILKTRSTEADGMEIYDFENYESFPIVPLWGNPYHQSELVGLREQIDCYDLIKSGFANDIDDASMIYWTIQNAGGMDDVDLAKFIERMHVVKAAVVDDAGARAEAHQMDVPYASREVMLDRLSRDLYRDAMALDTSVIAGGAVTATQIRAAYEPLNSKVDEYEYCVIEFLNDILSVAGIEDENPTFTRSTMINTSEEATVVLQAAQYLDGDYVTKKILEIFGDGDKANEMIDKMHEEEMMRMNLLMQQQTQGQSGSINLTGEAE